MSVVHWKFRDVWQTGPPPYTYTYPINPDDGGSPSFEKNLTNAVAVGPSRHAIAQEGAAQLPQMDFSGSILTQEHYEAMELWFDKRMLIEITDDLGRKFTGVLSAWKPARKRRARNFWYHTYSATFTILGYVTASGQNRFVAGGA